jgi:glycosyltransferase involved in cell wall biosynthesis
MPTLLAVNNYYYYRGGAETIFLEHEKVFSALGWQVVPFAMQHRLNLPTPWSKYFVDEIEFGAGYSLMEQVRRVPKVIYSLEARKKLGVLLDEVRPQICHAHNVYHHISPSVLGLLKRRGVPTVLTLHDLKIACPAYLMLAPDGICERCRGGRLYNVMVHRCIKRSAALSAVVFTEAVLHKMLGSYERCVDRFVVPSRFYLQKLSEWGFPVSRFRYIPNFVDVERYRPDFTPGNTFLFLGRLSREKGLGTLIRATAAARSKLVIVGRGPDLDELRALASQLQADVTFQGFLSGEPLHEAVRQARAVILPSECYENAPMTILEAYALGKPVIGARIGGIPELIREGETGFSFVSGDPQSLEAVLRKMADLPDSTLEAYGRAGRAWVESDFTATAYGHRMQDLYRELGAAQ